MRALLQEAWVALCENEVFHSWVQASKMVVVSVQKQVEVVACHSRQRSEMWLILRQQLVVLFGHLFADRMAIRLPGSVLVLGVVADDGHSAHSQKINIHIANV